MFSSSELSQAGMPCVLRERSRPFGDENHGKIRHKPPWVDFIVIPGGLDSVRQRRSTIT